MKTISMILAVVLVLAGCQPKQIEGGDQIAGEVEMHKVKRITQDQIFAEANLAGDSIVKRAQALLRVRVAETLEKEGMAAAIKMCRPETYPELDTLLHKYQAKISRVSQKPRNPANKPTGTVAELLDAYHYNSEQKLELQPNLQQQGQGQLLYTSAISISDQLCLRCHGTPGSDIAAADLLTLQAAYPADQATGYRTGDLRGMWVVQLEKEALAKQISARGKKKKRSRG